MPLGRARDLPLFWKLLLPFLALIVIFGSLGTFLIVRDLSVRAEEALDQDLARRSFEARSLAHDRELYLVESANFATNIQGMSDAIRTRNRRLVETLLGSVLALKTDVNLLVAADANGLGIVEFRRPGPTGGPSSSDGTRWDSHPLVGEVLRGSARDRRAGLIDDGGAHLLVIAAPICSASGCAAGTAGLAIVGISIERLAEEAVGQDSFRDGRRGGAAIYNSDGALLANAGVEAQGAAPPQPRDGRLLRRRSGTGREEVATLYAPFEVQGQRLGTLAATVPTTHVVASARGTAQRLGIVVLIGMLGVIAVGALLSRFILAQLRPLLATSRALGAGEFSSRAPVVSNDELGELSRGVNQMADQLQASYETLELRVAQRTEEVHRLLQERTEFFASVSHDLRTPLAVIRSQALMMLNPKFARQPPAEVAETIVVSSDQLLALINELLELSKAEAGRLDIDLEEVELQDVIEDLRRTIEGLALAGGQKLTIDVPNDLPPVLGDSRRLREMLLNLVDNAVKYTPPGGEVDVAAAYSGGRVTVRVRDNGIGIPEEAREKIFEPFYRVKGNRPQRGQASTGLGLALTKRFVEAHGGEIFFEDSPGGGTTFIFTLPTLEREHKTNGEVGRGRTSVVIDGDPGAPNDGGGRSTRPERRGV